MHEVLVNRLGGLSPPRKSVVRLTDRPDMILDVYRGRKTITQQRQQQNHTVQYIACARRAKSTSSKVALVKRFKTNILVYWVP